MAEEDKGYIDVTKGEVMLQKDQIEYIEKNPEGLTREGCEKKITDWNQSGNRYLKIMYSEMLKKCKLFSSSGKTDKGCIIYSRDKTGNPYWVSGK